MPLGFPIATSAKTALEAEEIARSKAEAARMLGADVTLVSDWFRPSPAQHKKLSKQIAAGVDNGFVQVYEDRNGNPTLAVSYWKRHKVKAVAKPDAPKPVRTGANDSTDDLYFSKAHKKKAEELAAKRAADKRQLDLFAPPPPKPTQPAKPKETNK